MNIQIRKVKPEDSDSIVELCKELGYYQSDKEIKTKLKKFELSKLEEVFVAEAKEVIGWIHISIVEPLESILFAEIRGVVVNKEFRGRGIGIGLIDKAVDWAKLNNCNKVRIRTNIKREETRKYYKNLNFESGKIQEVFEKEI